MSVTFNEALRGYLFANDLQGVSKSVSALGRVYNSVGAIHDDAGNVLLDDDGNEILED